MSHTKKLILAGLLGLVTTAAVPSFAQDQGNPEIIMISGPLFDPFFSALKKGADDAAADLGIEYQYSTVQDVSNVEADFARLVDQAVATGPDVIVMGNFFPNALNPIIKQATESGVPVIIQDGGFDSWRENGASTYIGYDPAVVGALAAQLEIEQGADKGLCVNHVPGNPTLEAACTAYIDAFEGAGGKAKLLTIALQDAQNPQANLQAIRGALESDPTINGIYTMGATQTTISAQAAAESGRADGEIKIVGAGLSTQVLEGVRDGAVLAGLDLQPYLDGYYGLLAAYQLVKYRFIAPEPIITGPRVVLQPDAQNIIDINAQYVGIRGVN